MLFDVVAFDIRNVPKTIPVVLPILLHVTARLFPDILRILTVGITRKLTEFRPLIVPLPRIFRFHPHRVEIEEVFRGIRIPQYDFIPPTKAMLAVQSMPEAPNYSVPQDEPEFLENRVEEIIQGVDTPSIVAAADYVISHLPAQTPCGLQSLCELNDHSSLLLSVLLQFHLLLIWFPNVVWRRCDNQIEKWFLRQRSKQILTVPVVDSAVGPPLRHGDGIRCDEDSSGFRLTEKFESVRFSFGVDHQN